MNCKPGDRAVIIASTFEENVGVRVMVLYRATRSVEGLPSWVILPDEPLLLRNASDPTNTPVTTSGKTIAHPDAWLKPLREVDNETIKQKEMVPA